MSKIDKKLKASIKENSREESGSVTGHIRVERLGKGKLKITADVIQADDILKNISREVSSNKSVILDLSGLTGGEENRLGNRIPYLGPVIVHEFNGETCWTGKARNLSISGVQLEVGCDSLDIGQHVVVEFLGTKELDAFGAKCEIVYVDWKYTEDLRPVANVGLRIIEIDNDAKKVLNSYVRKSAIKTESSNFADLLDVNKVIGK